MNKSNTRITVLSMGQYLILIVKGKGTRCIIQWHAACNVECINHSIIIALRQSMHRTYIRSIMFQPEMNASNILLIKYSSLSYITLNQQISHFPFLKASVNTIGCTYSRLADRQTCLYLGTINNTPWYLVFYYFEVYIEGVCIPCTGGEQG